MKDKTTSAETTGPERIFIQSYDKYAGKFGYFYFSPDDFAPTNPPVEYVRADLARVNESLVAALKGLSLKMCPDNSPCWCTAWDSTKHTPSCVAARVAIEAVPGQANAHLIAHALHSALKDAAELIGRYKEALGDCGQFIGSDKEQEDAIHAALALATESK